MKAINPMVSISSANSPPFRRRCRRHRLAFTVTAAIERADDNNNNQHYASGKLVDESMIELRLRIHKIKMAEQISHNPPTSGLEWEKRFYADYDSHVCEALGYLQSHLMNTRPSVVFGMLALLTLSVPVSSTVVLHSLFQVAFALLAHLS